MLALQTLHEEWAAHPKGKHRALGGRVALGGFLFQLYVSLDRFFARVLKGDPGASLAFEGLSDISELKGALVYLTQVKSTLDRQGVISAVQEALAVSQFLADKHPDLQDRVRFQVAARRVGGATPLDFEALTAEALALEDAQIPLWYAIRGRFLPVQIRANPKVDLAIRLWPHATKCFPLLDGLLGRLFALLGDNRPSAEIAEHLLKVWDQFRAVGRPPGHLLGPRELVSDQVSMSRIVQGVRPRPEDLLDGCFMQRPMLLESALATIRAASFNPNATPNQQLIPVYWIVGASGAGKSVLLLQLMKELVAQGDVETANYLGEFAQALPDSLEYWADSPSRTLIVVDDLFAPEHRDFHVWRQAAHVAFTAKWQQVPWILTCGPVEQLKAFRKEMSKHREWQLIEIQVDPMTAVEQSDYHLWYQQRTGVTVSRASEPIFVAATWTYELRREADLSPEAFALRFYSRLGELGLQTQARAAMALDQHGIKSPEGLFVGKETELYQLTSEQVYRFGNSAQSLRGGRFFHPRISKLIYDVIVPETEVRWRANDLARGFGAMLNEGAAADTFLAWLDAPRSQAAISPALRQYTLVAMWTEFQKHEPSEDVVPRLKRWHKMARASNAGLEEIGASREIRNWFRATPENAITWGLLFQVVWDDAQGEQRDRLFVAGKLWLGRSLEAPSWNWVWQQLWTHGPLDHSLIELAFRWLGDNLAHPGWSRVWQCLYDAGVRTANLLQSALVAIPFLPESTADFPIWQKIRKLDPPKAHFLSCILGKLTHTRNTYKLELRAEFILRELQDDELSTILLPAIAGSLQGPSWPYLWLALNRSLEFVDDIKKGVLLPIGRRWLTGREDHPAWSHVWRFLIERGFQLDDLLGIGRDWLNNRENRPDWAYIWQRLLGARFKPDMLYRIGRDWLVDREDRPEWGYVWGRLVNGGFELDSLIAKGRDWLTDREDMPAWPYVWERLIQVGFDREILLPIGRDWLKGREDRPGWGYVVKDLVKFNFEIDTVLDIARAWLSGRQDRTAYPHVFRIVSGRWPKNVPRQGGGM